MTISIHISIVLCTNTNSIYVLISTNILYLRTSNLQNDTSGIRRVSESHEQFTGLSRYTLKMACESRGEILLSANSPNCNVSSAFQHRRQHFPIYISKQKRAEKTGKATSTHTATFLRGGTAEVGA